VPSASARAWAVAGQVLSHMTRKAISEDSIYTLKLVRRGHVVPEGLQVGVEEGAPPPPLK
jgi:hypothetical protein